MDLIKQLGGYEKAKVILQAVGHEHDAMLLEHRRANNIFEVGDKVVGKEDHKLVKTVILISNGLARLKCLQFDHVYPLFNFRHATDAEIAAGHRL